MKNFLIEFFRPLDNLIFNYFVNIGVIKPIVGAIVGGLISARSASRQASKARKASSKAIEGAIGELRDPTDILRGAYEKGIYSPEIMDLIIGAEEELLPKFQRLGETAARGVSGFQEASKLRQLDLLGRLGGDVRGALEDPRLAELAELDLAEAQRLSEEARGPLSGERARAAEQTALGMAVRQGRGRGQGAIAQAILGRTQAKSALEQQAAAARQRALGSASAAMVDPSAFLLRPSSTEEQIFLQSRLGPQITDPGQAVTLGSAIDTQKASARLNQALAAAQLGAAQTSAMGNIFGSMLGNLGSLGSKGGAQTPATPATPAQGGGGGGFGGLTGDPNTNVFDNFFKMFGG